jgi:hypothetical protein
LLPQKPQLLLAVCGSTHTQSQRIIEETQPAHIPLQQQPSAQCLPHPPQLLGSLARLTHFPLQTVLPGWQAHAPAVQKKKFAVSHLLPQVPQLLLSLLVSTHEPPVGGQQVSVPVHPQKHRPWMH